MVNIAVENEIKDMAMKHSEKIKGLPGRIYSGIAGLALGAIGGVFHILDQEQIGNMFLTGSAFPVIASVVLLADIRVANREIRLLLTQQKKSHPVSFSNAVRAVECNVCDKTKRLLAEIGGGKEGC